MVLAKNIWYVRWFFWSCRVLDRAFNITTDIFSVNRRRSVKYQKQASLCKFFEILFFGNLIFLLNVAIYLFAGFALLSPLILYGVVDAEYVYTRIIIVISIILGVVIGIAIIFGLAFGTKVLFRKMFSDDVKPEHPTFTTLFKNYVKGIKDRICPLIVFTENKP